MDIKLLINQLLNYGLKKQLFNELDFDYIANKLISFLHVSEFYKENSDEFEFLDTIEKIYSYALSNKLINDTLYEKEIFIATLLDLMLPRPSEVQKTFSNLYKEDPKLATNYFYELANNSYYIQYDKVAKNKKWVYESSYGKIDMTINLSKPEKDPKEIVLAKIANTSNYPTCLLCKENVGYKGRINHPARSNLRVIKLNVNNEDWYFQYSPYTYYNEHCILLSSDHRPMKISKNTFINMLDFVDQFKHYFMGSNADLPIVGGSILSHDHYQGGNYHFPIEDAKVINKRELKNGVQLATLKWPLSVIRISSNDKNKLVETADKIYGLWTKYSDESASIIAYTNEPHNTITPIARYKNAQYELDLILRNNRTSKEYPYGIFHAHEDVHNIKKENLGLIEVMGLAILPARLDTELTLIKKVISENLDINNYPELLKHKAMIERLRVYHSDVDLEQKIYDETARIFVKGLEDAAVFKGDENGVFAFNKLIDLIYNNI
jgi:UDPglucose--hexose-1-phosphate uridylyltransferase